MNDALIKAIDLHLARESFAAALLALIDGTGTGDAVAAAEARLDAAARAVEIGRDAVPSYYLSNAR
jgi:hypothetical protein